MDVTLRCPHCPHKVTRPTTGRAVAALRVHSADEHHLEPLPARCPVCQRIVAGAADPNHDGAAHDARTADRPS